MASKKMELLAKNSLTTLENMDVALPGNVFGVKYVSADYGEFLYETYLECYIQARRKTMSFSKMHFNWEYADNIPVDIQSESTKNKIKSEVQRTLDGIRIFKVAVKECKN
jgi:hypothetical protein